MEWKDIREWNCHLQMDMKNDMIWKIIFNIFPFLLLTHTSLGSPRTHMPPGLHHLSHCSWRNLFECAIFLFPKESDSLYSPPWHYQCEYFSISNFNIYTKKDIHMTTWQKNDLQNWTEPSLKKCRKKGRWNESQRAGNEAARRNEFLENDL